MEILPYEFGEDGASEFAAAKDAGLAVGRGEVTPENPWSLPR